MGRSSLGTGRHYLYEDVKRLKHGLLSEYNDDWLSWPSTTPAVVQDMVMMSLIVCATLVYYKQNCQGACPAMRHRFDCMGVSPTLRSTDSDMALDMRSCL